MTKTKYELQVEFCEKKKVPIFAPEEKCWRCGAHIWDYISEESAKGKLITGCPKCSYSYCE